MFFQRPMVAIDIGSSAIKLLELTLGEPRSIRRVAIESLPSGLVVDGAVMDKDTLKYRLRRLLASVKMRPLWRRAALSVGGSSVLVKKAFFPKQNSDSDFAEAVYYEAEQHFQHDITDLYFDFHRLEAKADSSEVPVILVGVKKSLVDQRIEVVKEVGFTIGAVDCDVFAAYNSLICNYGVQNGLIASVNIGDSLTQVSIIHNGQYLFTRDVPIGGSHFSSALAESCHVSNDEAIALKIAAVRGSGDDVAQIRDILDGLSGDLANRIKLTFDFFFQNEDMGSQSVQRIYLSGGSASLYGLRKKIEDVLGLKTEVADPFRKLKISNRDNLSSNSIYSHQFSIATGLGIRRFEYAKT